MRRFLCVLTCLAFVLAAAAHADAPGGPPKKKRRAKASAKPFQPSAAPAPAAAAPPPAPTPEELARQAWTEARALADRGQHEQALARIDEGLRQKPGDVDLLWLQASVTGWAGRNAEAVSLFEKLVALHPELVRATRVDLGTQRLWAGDPAGALRDYDLKLEESPGDREALRMRALALSHANRLEESLAAYDTLLAANPGDVNLSLERARVLGWMGRHDDAAAAYESVLAAHPEERRARLGLAQNENWRGHHRRAVELYEQLSSEQTTADPDVQKGLAYAYYWSGQGEQAREPLGRFLTQKPDDGEGQRLAALLVREQTPSLTVGYERSDDTDDLRIRSTSVDYRHPFNGSRAFLARWRTDEARDPFGSRNPWRIGAGLEKQWSERWSGRAMLFLLKPSEDEAGIGLADASLTHRPTDQLRLDFGWSKDVVLTRLALEQGVWVNTWVAGADWHVHPRLALRASERVGFFNDDNQQSRFSASARTPFRIPRGRVEVSFGVDHLRSRDDLDHGYYDPERYLELGPGAEAEWHPTSDRWMLGLRARLGLQRENDLPMDPFTNATALAEGPLGQGAVLHVEAGFSDSNLSSASGFGQNRWAAWISSGF